MSKVYDVYRWLFLLRSGKYGAASFPIQCTSTETIFKEMKETRLLQADLWLSSALGYVIPTYSLGKKCSKSMKDYEKSKLEPFRNHLGGHQKQTEPLQLCLRSLNKQKLRNTTESPAAPESMMSLCAAGSESFFTRPCSLKKAHCPLLPCVENPQLFVQPSMQHWKGTSQHRKKKKKRPPSDREV